MAKSTSLQSLDHLGRKPAVSKAPSALTAPTAAAIDGKARYVFALKLETQSLLRIGSGEDRQCSESEAPDTPADERPFVADLVRDDAGNGYIPGATLKGVVLRRALALGGAIPDYLRFKLFGEIHGRDDIRPGQAEFSGLQVRADGYREQLETRIAIDRNTRTVEDGMLANADAVAPKSTFIGQVLLQHATHDEATAFYQLLGAGRPIPLQLGSNGRRGWGQVNLTVEATKVFGREQAAKWWTNQGPENQHWQAMAVPITLNQSLPLQVPDRCTCLPLSLEIDGPFAVRDPRHHKKKAAAGRPNSAPDTKPLQRDGRPVLPGSSFLGALRSQAERILRSLGGSVPAFNAPPDRLGVAPADPVSLLFGCVGWRGVLRVRSDFLGEPGTERIEQDMVALCRVTGGGKDHAKFKFAAFVNPTLIGDLLLDSHRLRGLLTDDGDSSLARTRHEAALGLLWLTLQDLALGDITLGMAASKGWGWVKPQEHQLESWKSFVEEPTDKLVSALRKWCGLPVEVKSVPVGAQEKVDTVGGRPTPYRRVERGIPTLSRGSGSGKFHNPYHFLPFAKLHGMLPASEAAIGVSQQAQCLEHSHARYHPGRLSGRIAVKLLAVSPLFIGAERKPEPKRPTRVDPFMMSNELAIPGSSLRGMLSQWLEPMSGSAMRVLDDEAMISVRMSASPKEQRRIRGVVVEDGVDKGGERVLKVQRLTDEIPPKPTGEKIPISPKAVSMLYALADERWRAVGSKLTEQQLTNNKTRLHVSTKDRSHPTQKGELDLLPAIDQISGNPVSLRERNPDPNTLGTRARLMPDQIVFFKLSPDGKEVCDLAWSQLYRRAPWGGFDKDQGPLTLRRFIAQSEPDRLPLGMRPSTRLHAAEWLLGAVGLAPPGTDREVSGLAFAGKLLIGTAKPTQEVGANQLNEFVHLKELSAPKPPSPNLYCKTKSGEAQPVSKINLVDKHGDYELQGTKVYLHANGLGPNSPATPIGETGESGIGHEPWRSFKSTAPPASDSKYVLTDRQVSVRPIAPKSEFEFEIRFTNLSDAELDLLCAALQPSPKFLHKLGMGRPIGMGSVQLRISSIRLDDRQARYAGHSATQLPTSTSGAERACRGMTTLHGADPVLYEAMLALGEPENVQHPVHYPQVHGEKIEHKNYQWWLAAEKETDHAPEGWFLRPIGQET